MCVVWTGASGGAEVEREGSKGKCGKWGEWGEQPSCKTLRPDAIGLSAYSASGLQHSNLDSDESRPVSSKRVIPVETSAVRVQYGERRLRGATQEWAPALDLIWCCLTS